MKSSKSDYFFNNQHCWARFTCPDDRHAEFKIASSFELDTDYDYLTLYGIHSDQLTSITDSFSNTARWIQIFQSNFEQIILEPTVDTIWNSDVCPTDYL